MEQVNEIKRLVIETQCTEIFGSLGPEVVGVAIELVGGVERCTPVLNSPGHAYSLIGAVCSKRAVDVVGGELMVTGKKVKPEDYIPLWRQALADRKSIKRALDEDGVELTFIARGHLERQRASSRHSTNDPMDGFTGWIAKLGKRMNVDADGYFTLRLDGIEMDACRDWHFISGYRDYQDKDPRNESSMEVRLVGAKCVDKNESQPIQQESGKQVALFS